MNWKCPQCGQNNKETAKLCGLCGEMRPAEKPQEVVARAMTPAMPPPLPPPLPLQTPPHYDGWAPGRSGPLSEDEKRRIAEEAASRIMGSSARPPQQQGAGCGTVAVFIMLLPWSLLVLPMPGGLRNKKALNVMLVIAAVVIFLGFVSMAIAIPRILPLIQRAMSATQGAYNVPGD